MTRRPVFGFALAALFGFSLIVPCLTMGMRDARMGPEEGCGSRQATPTDLVCATSFTPAPSPEAPQTVTIAVTRSAAEAPVAFSIRDLAGSGMDRGVRGDAPPAYLLHSTFLI